MHISIILYFALAAITVRLAIFIYQALTSPLRDIPGPLIARFTRLWYLNQVYIGDFHKTNLELHRQYGPIVRIAPNLYSISSPDKAVYGIGTKFPKSDWYEGWKHPSPERWTLFPDQNMKRHAETRRKFQAMYSMSSLVSYEGYVDTCAGIFHEKLDQFVKSGEVIDMAHWFQCYAFDVIGEITYSKRFGFLDRGEDIAGIMAALESAMLYGSCIGVYAWLHPYAYKLTENLPGSGAAGRTYLMNFVRERIANRNEERSKKAPKDKTSTKDVEAGVGAPEDFLDKITNVHEDDPEKVTAYHIFMMNLSNIIAGSDTTAVSLSSVLYHLLKYPATMEKLRKEIEQFEYAGKCGRTSVTFAESQAMPYLQAVLKEALRMHSATGLPLWRVVPREGAEVCDRFFPGGSEVGINTWVAHYDESVYGRDVMEFRPERWIEAEKEGGERLKSMEAHYMPFGLGSRTCLGRHISILEMSKLVPMLVRAFDFELEHPYKTWTTKNHWFVKPRDFTVRVKSRRTEKQ